MLRIVGTAVLLFVALSGVPAAADGNRVPRVDEYEDSLATASLGFLTALAMDSRFRCDD